MSEKDAKKTINEGYIRKGAERIKDKDFEKVIDKSEEIRKKFESGGPLGRFIEDFKLLMGVVVDYWNKKYRDIPYWAISAIVFALIYVLSPIDLIPDFIPVIGLVDDALVVAICLSLVEHQLHNYKEWKINNPD